MIFFLFLSSLLPKFLPPSSLSISSPSLSLPFSLSSLHQFPEKKRAQTFSSSNSRPSSGRQYLPPTHRPLQIPMDDGDSLPSSPTYFMQNRSEDRETPSPHTQMVNQSFQEHLESLDPQSKVRKRKVLDWIQRSSNEAWEKENSKKENDDQSRLKLDPMTHLPSKQYSRQVPIYATADNPDFAAESGNHPRSRTIGSASTQRYNLESNRGMGELNTGMGNQRYRTDPWQRVASDSRAHHMEQRQYPPRTTHSLGAGQARVGSAGRQRPPPPQQNAGPVSYPSAKFGKDYYVLDV